MNDIASILEAEIDKTLKQIAEYRELVKPIAPDVAIGRISRMDAINNKSINEAALRKAEQKLNNLKRVQSMIGKPDFGHCLQCKKQIPVGRLVAMPGSLYCVSCASR